MSSFSTGRLGLEEVLDTIFEGVYFVDRDRTIVKWNPGASKVTGFSLQEVEHRCCSDNVLVHVDEIGTELCKKGCPLFATIQDGCTREGRVFLRHKNGYRVPVQIRTAAMRDESGSIVGAVESFRELGDPEALASRMADLEKAAFADPLTGIPNRRYVETQLDRMVRDYEAAATPFTLCIFDIDHYKLTNDTYGHSVGDAALRTIAHTLQNCLRASDVLGRWGGDEFLLLLPCTNASAARTIIERCRVLVESSNTSYDGHQIRHTVSAGGAVIRPYEDTQALLTRADARLYEAKQRGRNCIRVE